MALSYLIVPVCHGLVTITVPGPVPGPLNWGNYSKWNSAIINIIDYDCDFRIEKCIRLNGLGYIYKFFQNGNAHVLLIIHTPALKC